MRDLNFFEPYIEKRSFKFNKSILIYALIMLLVLTGVAYAILNQLTIAALEKDVANRKEVAENPRTVEKVNEIKELEAEVDRFREEVLKIIHMDETIEANDVIGDELLKFIKSKMPNDLFLTNLSVYNREIQISGVAKDKYTIAEFGKGLEEMDEAESIFISNITQDELYYKFVLNLTLKEVILDAEESVE